MYIVVLQSRMLSYEMGCQFNASDVLKTTEILLKQEMDRGETLLELFWGHILHHTVNTSKLSGEVSTHA